MTPSKDFQKLFALLQKCNVRHVDFVYSTLPYSSYYIVHIRSGEVYTSYVLKLLRDGSLTIKEFFHE